MFWPVWRSERLAIDFAIDFVSIALPERQARGRSMTANAVEFAATEGGARS
jgi:hypothetical protein